MANIKMLFYGTETHNTEHTYVECFANDHNEIFIQVEMDSCPASYLSLDKETAIKFQRELKKQISFLNSQE